MEAIQYIFQQNRQEYPSQQEDLIVPLFGELTWNYTEIEYLDQDHLVLTYNS